MSSDGHREAAAQFRDALREVGLDTTLNLRRSDQGAAVDVVGPGGIQIPVVIIQRSLMTDRDLPQLLVDSEEGTDPGIAHVVVADRVTVRARHDLRRHGWGWLDLRGHVHLQAAGIFIDAPVTPVSETFGASKEPLTGRVGLELAALLLMRPTAETGIRAAAAELGRSPSSVSVEMSRLRDAGLVQGSHPVIPDLFHALAFRWRPESVDVSAVPESLPAPLFDALHTGLIDYEKHVGWALGDSLAAVAYGAPLSVSGAYPPDLFVPDKVTLRRAIQLLGTAKSHEDRAATLRLAPIPLVCEARVDGKPFGNSRWPLAHPLFVALDLAQDPVRGSEALATWEPPRWWQRVW